MFFFSRRRRHTRSCLVSWAREMCLRNRAWNRARCSTHPCCTEHTGAWWVLGATGKPGAEASRPSARASADPAAGSPARWCGRAAGIRSARLRLVPPAHGHGGAQHHRHGPYAQAHRWAPRGGHQNAAPGAPGPGWAPVPEPAAGRPAKPPAMRAHRHPGARRCTHAGGAVAKAGAWQMKGEEISAAKTGQRGAAAARYFTGTASTRR